MEEKKTKYKVQLKQVEEHALVFQLIDDFHWVYEVTVDWVTLRLVGLTSPSGEVPVKMVSRVRELEWVLHDVYVEMAIEGDQRVRPEVELAKLAVELVKLGEVQILVEEGLSPETKLRQQASGWVGLCVPKRADNKVLIFALTDEQGHITDEVELDSQTLQPRSQTSLENWKKCLVAIGNNWNSGATIQKPVFFGIREDKSYEVSEGNWRGYKLKYGSDLVRVLPRYRDLVEQVLRKQASRMSSVSYFEKVGELTKAERAYVHFLLRGGTYEFLRS